MSDVPADYAQSIGLEGALKRTTQLLKVDRAEIIEGAAEAVPPGWDHVRSVTLYAEPGRLGYSRVGGPTLTAPPSGSPPRSTSISTQAPSDARAPMRGGRSR
ncbi:hypothetical protein [Streptomyces sp. NPDC093707]|uniref:hypothetical protein n=1 Tax=Streptomyces sp. NPDC093707 TaxID=3154984 RepID=UPI00344F2409